MATQPDASICLAPIKATTSSIETLSILLQDFEPGSGIVPEDGQEVVFHYTAYNESGLRIDSSFSKGRPAQTRLGIKGLIPGVHLVKLVCWAACCH